MKDKLLILLACVACLLSACEKMPVATNTGPATGDSAANLTFRGFKVRASHEGSLTWEAEALRAKVFQQANQAEAEQVTMTYFQNGRRVSQAQADRADINLKDYGVKARGNVRVTGSNGVVLLTQELDWDNAHQLATSNVKVRLERKGTVLTGWGMRADRALQDVRILHDVQAEAQSINELRKVGQGLKP